jgi:superfamily II DNA/RNA helicase
MAKTTYQDIDYQDFDSAIGDIHDGLLLKGLYEYKFDKPSPIQAKTIQPIKDGRDLIAQAQSGSGKTGAFIIGAFTKITLSKCHPQIVILANTHELATQIHSVAKEIGKFMKVNIALCVGGQRNTIEENLKEAKKSHMLVCTPGRLNGLLKFYPNLFDGLKMVIFDEADQLLSDGFIEQIKFILSSVDEKTQMCLFSATSNSDNIKRTKDEFTNNPVEIYIKKDNIKVNLIRNYVVDAENESNKFLILMDLYTKISICQAVIFVNTVERANELATKLRAEGHGIGVIHAQLPEQERIETMKNFRKTLIRTLIATDIIARGIDVQQVGLVINYDIPRCAGFKEQYIHRVGRSGRYGKLGVAINIMTNNRAEWIRLQEIEKTYKIRFDDLPELSEINYILSGVKGYSYDNMAS